MKDKQLDCLFVTPSAASKLYQDLAKDISVKEPVPWTGMLAQSCRSKGFGVAILDMEVERLSYEATVELISCIDPKLVVFCCYGQNPNSSTASMTGATGVAEILRNTYPKYKICFVGPHVNALPFEVLERHPFVDIVLTNEGVYALYNLLASNLESDLKDINGIGYRKDGQPWLNHPERLVPQELLEYDLPGIAWDLLPSLDKYRTGYWQGYFKDDVRGPFASIYTSLGCPFTCNFCMINIINRTDNDLTKSANDFNTFRYWNPDFMIKQFDYLAENNVKYIKLADELFQLKPKHFLTLCDKIAERGYNFNIWSYTRVDTVKEQYLDRLQKAGIVWHAIGIESSEQSIRMEIDKGRFKDVNIREIVKMIHDRGMDVGANYIFGLGHDNFDTMQKTLELAIELNTVNANMYCATPLPGSPLYMQMKQQGWDLPKNYDEYSFLSYAHRPSPTASCSTEDILYFRDYAYRTYYEHPKFINMLATRFGQKAVDKNAEMNKIRLRRQLLENNALYKG